MAASISAVAVPPRRPGSETTTSWIWQELGQVERALAVFEQGIAINPEDPELLCRKGLMLGAVGRYGDAEAAPP